MPLTHKQFRTLTWIEAYSYGQKGDRTHFKVFGCSDCPQISIVHDYKRGGGTAISYRVNGRSTDSPTVAIKWHNAIERGQRSAPGSPKSTGEATAPVR